MDKLRKIRRLLRKDRLWANNIAKRESDLLKTNEANLPPPPNPNPNPNASSNPTPPPAPFNIQTSVNFRNFVELYVARCHFQTWQVC